MALPARGVPIERSTPLGRGLWGALVWHSFLLRGSIEGRDMGKADYFVKHGDVERGPTTSARIRELAATGKLSKDDAIRRGENGDWFRAGDLPGLFGNPGEPDGELLKDPLANLAEHAAGTIAKAAGTFGKAAGQIGGALKGMMARRDHDVTIPPAAQPPLKAPQQTVRIRAVEPILLSEGQMIEETTLCPFCSETIMNGAKKCRHCGEILDVVLREVRQSTVAPPVHIQPAPNITINNPINVSSRSESQATARSRQKATAVAKSFWSRPLSGCGCLATVMAAALIGIPLFVVFVGIFGKPRTAQTPADREKAKGNVAPVLVAQQGADRSPADQQPVNKEDQLVEDSLQSEEAPEVEQGQTAAAEKAEHDATSKLRAAISMMSGNKKVATERLKEIVEKYPDTEAAEDAKELLAGREPKPHPPREHKHAPQSSQGVAEGTRARVLSSKLVDFVSPTNGRKMQMVIVTLKNTGSTPVRGVQATIISRDASGKIVTRENFSIFAEFDSSPGIAPGQTWTTPKGEGYILPNYGVGTRAKKAEVRITEVLEHAGMEH